MAREQSVVYFAGEKFCGRGQIVNFARRANSAPLLHPCVGEREPNKLALGFLPSTISVHVILSLNKEPYYFHSHILWVCSSTRWLGTNTIIIIVLIFGSDIQIV